MIYALRFSKDAERENADQNVDEPTKLEKTYLTYCDCGDFAGNMTQFAKANAIEVVKMHLNAGHGCGTAEVQTVVDGRIKSRLTVKSRAWIADHR